MRIGFRFASALAIVTAIICANICATPVWAQTKQRDAQASTDGVRAKLFEEADAAMQIAREEDAAILAPNAFASGLLSYQQAGNKFQQGGKLEEIRAHVNEATQHFQQALAAAQWAGHTFILTLTARDDARHAQAPTYAPELWQQTEAKMQKAARALEEGHLKSALKQAPAIEKQYRQAELIAIQKHARPDWRELSQSLDEQRDDLATLKQDFDSSSARVNTLQQQVKALENTLTGGRTTAPAQTTVRQTAQAKVEIDAALQAYFSRDEALVLRKDGGLIIRLFDIDFFANTPRLSSAGAGALSKVRDILRRFPRGSVAVAGHVYSAGNQRENLRISRERAESVKRYLMENLAVPLPLVAIGYGDTAPIPKGELLDGPVKNERLDVLVEFAPSAMSYSYR